MLITASQPNPTPSAANKEQMNNLTIAMQLPAKKENGLGGRIRGHLDNSNYYKTQQAANPCPPGC
jgi:hypothetical protein